ncbi:MAG: hypothetical protein JW860_04530, partial [Sedimentisphaerales bacterium]|nr:hypothetical protein [Sedimentisphaerales bacterium]
MGKCLSEQDFKAFISGAASAEQTTTFRHHLRVCDTCALEMARRQTVREKACAPVEADPDEVPGIDDHYICSGLEPNILIGDFRIEKRLDAG